MEIKDAIPVLSALEHEGRLAIFRHLVTAGPGGVKAGERNITDAVSASIVGTAREVGAKIIVAFTASGFTARMISRYKPSQPIIALTPSQRVANQLRLTWGVIPVVMPKITAHADVLKAVRAEVRRLKLGEKGDLAVIAAGIPLGKLGSTNTMHVEVI